MISYKLLQKMLIDKDLKKTELMQIANISSATMARLNTNQYVSLEVVDRICKALECQPGDLLEYIPDPNKRPATKLHKEAATIGNTDDEEDFEYEEDEFKDEDETAGQNLCGTCIICEAKDALSCNGLRVFDQTKCPDEQ